MKRIAITLFEGVEEMDAVAPYEVLCAAKHLGAQLEVDFVTHSAGTTVGAFHGMKIAGVKPFSDATSWDIIVVPGGAWLSEAPTGVRGAVDEGILPDLLRRQHAQGAILASVCTGAFLLAEAGLLIGRDAATHHSARENLRAYQANPVDERVVDCGDILSAGGVTSGLDLALWILERFFGVDIAHRTEEYLEYTRRDGVYRGR